MAKATTSKPKEASGKPAIHQLKITLRGSKPPIWRRVEVRSDSTLADLHDVIQTVMDWHDSHLHAFTVNGMEYSSNQMRGELGMADESKVKLNKVAPIIGSKVSYQYDFGDDWDHQIVVEKLLPVADGVNYPRCTAGKRAGPPEDVGGIWGYADILETFQRKQAEKAAGLAPTVVERDDDNDDGDDDFDDDDEMLEWLGDDFDPEAFDMTAINERLKRLRLG